MEQLWRHPTDREIEDEIEEAVYPRVRQALDSPVGSDCPRRCLCHNVDQRRVATLVNQFNDGRMNWTHAVYVLECRRRAVPQKVAREELQLQHPSRWVEQAQDSERLLYVGVSRNVVNRLLEHAAGRGSGANFTQLFPASRLLSVEWYPSRSLAYRSEPITADVIREKTRDGVFVSQPG